jgi:hypothetical protein
MIDKEEDNLEEVMGELESLIKDNQVLFKKQNVDTDNIFNIFNEIKKTQFEISKLNKELYERTRKTK